MKKTILAGFVFLLLIPVHQEAFSSARGNNEDIVEEEENPAFLKLSLGEQEAQNPRIREMIAASQATREKAKLAQEEREKEEYERRLINDPIPEHLMGFFAPIQDVYQLLSSPNASQEFRENTSRVKRGLVVLAANLRGKTVPDVPSGQGFTESEWPKNERDLWVEIKKYASQGYGDNKQGIHFAQEALISLQKERGGVKFIPYVFDGRYNIRKPNATDNTLTPFLTENEEMCEKIQKLITEKKASMGDDGNEGDKKKLTALENCHTWGKIGSVFILALDTAQTNGWDNWTRTCFVAAFMDALESFKVSRFLVIGNE